jgi:hypothetical protein
MPKFILFELTLSLSFWFWLNFGDEYICMIIRYTRLAQESVLKFYIGLIIKVSSLLLHLAFSVSRCSM